VPAPLAMRRAAAALVVVATVLVAAETRNQIYLRTPFGGISAAVVVGMLGLVIAALIYPRRLPRPTDRRGWLQLWGLLSALLMFGSLGPWLRAGLGDSGGLQRGHGWLVLVAAVAGAAGLVVWRQRRVAGAAALLAGLVGLGVTLHAATHIRGLIPPRTQFLEIGPFKPLKFSFSTFAGWGLDLALLGSLSLALCGLVWLLASRSSARRQSASERDASPGLAELH